MSYWPGSEAEQVALIAAVLRRRGQANPHLGMYPNSRGIQFRGATDLRRVFELAGEWHFWSWQRCAEETGLPMARWTDNKPCMPAMRSLACRNTDLKVAHA